jgi:UDP-glucose 4-epimerase
MAILVTGGLGFIGLHTARALLDQGESCVLTKHRTTREPDFLKDEIGKRVFIEQVDVTDQSALLDVGKRHKINGIVHLAGAGIGTLGLIEDLRVSIDGLLNVLQAAKDWEVSRVSVASTIGVYGGVQQSSFREDMPLPMTGVHPIPTFKKCSEILTTFVGGHAGFSVANLRISAVWGPLGRPESNFFAAPRLVHAAVHGEAPDFSPPRQPAYAEDGIDMCYVKDCGRAIALLQTADKLNHRTYNVGSGRATKNAEVAAAIRGVIPDAEIELPEGRNPHGPGEDPYLDITRLREDTGYEPAYDAKGGVIDYIDWLRAGHER